MIALMITVLALYNAAVGNVGYRGAALCIAGSWLLYGIQNIRITYKRLPEL